MRLLELFTPRRLAAGFLSLAVVGFGLTLFYLGDTFRPLVPILQQSCPPPIESDNHNSTYTHTVGTYANAYRTSYTSGTEKVFLMIKTGATVLWDRFPIHLSTTLPQVPYFALYSDSPDKIAGIPVIDILSHTSADLQASDELKMYRRQAALVNEHANIELYDPKAEIHGAWDLDRFKNMPMIAHAYKTRPDAEWYIFMDADSYILWPNMMRWLRTLNSSDMLYMGSVAYLGNEPFAHGGSGVIMSGGLVRKTFGAEPDLQFQYEEFTKSHCCGDHVVAHAFLDRDIHVLSGATYPYVSWRIQGEPPISARFKKDNWCAEIVTFHHLHAHDVEKLYEFERKFSPDTPILYKDVYKEFIMPYITETRHRWDNLADSREYSLEKENDHKNPVETAYHSMKDCAAACEAWENCLQYRYKKGWCGLTDVIRLGQKEVGDGEKYTSAWMLDRIKSIRRSNSCDSLEGEGAYFAQMNEENAV
ncbi:hypothetical protein V1512DRAFT_293294 [Lipomyces arxii]|uniref:uncharacterized protein n=1 Tax=Lipomyces arxii TaxID=56418 RepID=UPI0034CDD25F